MYRVAVYTILFGLLSAPVIASGDEPEQWVRRNMDELVALYQQLHANPELSFCEQETAKRIAQEWTDIGAQVTTGIGGHGVVGLLGNGDGPTVMLRTDLDALPITEQTGLPCASTVTVKNESGVEVGVMHACGHDAHMSNVVGVARYLAANKDRWRGTVMLVGQPAEEHGAGAKAMLDDGLFKRFPKPDFALALHVDASLATGLVGYRAGYSMANVDAVDITVRGRGGHGAKPHTTIDPVVQAAELIMSLQTIVSREVKAIEPAVITVGSIHGGTKHNIIPDQCHLELTVRSYSDEVRQQLLSGIERKAKAVAAGAGAPEPTVEVTEGTPSLRNDEKLVERIAPVFRRALGDDKVILSDPAMVAEDFSHYGRAGVPILMFRLGVVDPERLARYKEAGQQPPPLHSSQFYPDIEDTLVTGVTAMASAALELLKP
ncbi:MAG: amidohydrolase [Planctomycetes bacterium]|nr:amidohydrolase [Planctomycetota bacterium]MBL7040991.1 amidohydrolase [Pirellulaceae bacterium]